LNISYNYLSNRREPPTMGKQLANFITCESSAPFCSLQSRVGTHSRIGHRLVWRASSTTETGRHDIVEILLKVVLSTISQIKSNPFISKRGPLEFVVQSHSLLTLSLFNRGQLQTQHVICNRTYDILWLSFVFF
jgi:hypothetical protein